MAKKSKQLERNLVPHHFPIRIWYYAVVSPSGEILEKWGTLAEAQDSLRKNNKYIKSEGYRCDSFVSIQK